MDRPQFELHAEIEQQHWWFTGRREIMRAVLERLVPPNGQAVVLDVGCGTGGNIASLADAYRPIGIDTSTAGIELARKRFPNVEFIDGYAPQELGDRMQDVAAVLLMDVLEHVPDDFQLFSELLASVKPGTWFLMTVPAELELWSEHDVHFGHYRRYDIARFQEVWRGQPVDCRLAGYCNTRLYPIVRHIRERNRRRKTTYGKAGTDMHVPIGPVNWILKRIFAGEARGLVKAMRSGQPLSARHGVSLIAALQRLPGPVDIRHKPAEFEDYYDPASGTYIQEAPVTLSAT